MYSIGISMFFGGLSSPLIFPCGGFDVRNGLNLFANGWVMHMVVMCDVLDLHML